MSRIVSDLLLPAGTRLLHIGPHKTGTTSIQNAFHAARREVARQGVHYAGPNPQPGHAVQAATARGTPDAARRPVRRWHALVKEIRGSKAGRVVVSSEWFDDAQPPAIRMLVDDLDPARVHVVVTLRPLASILPSQWQQSVQGSMPVQYERFLEDVFSELPSPSASRFWHRHRHDALIVRWATVVGRDRLTVVLADDRDHGAIPRAFEHLVGLRPGTLVPVVDRTNRSLTGPEIELVRRLNLALVDEGVPWGLRLNTVLFGAALALKRRTPSRDEARIETPAWAVDEIARAARGIVAGIESSGVRVVGDLATLGAPSTQAPAVPSPAAPSPSGASTASAPDASEIWPEIAAEASMGVLLSTGHGRARSGREPADPWADGVVVAADSTPGRVEGPPQSTDDADLDTISLTRMRKVFTHRVRGAVGARLRRVRSTSRAGGEPASIHSKQPEVE